MTIQIENGWTIVALLLVVFAQGYIAYWIWYMKKKGENIATKEDLRQLTEIEQEVKEDFNKRLEQLKSELSAISNQRISIASEIREVIYQYYEKYMLWFNKATTYTLPKYDEDTCNKYNQELTQRYSDLQIARAKIQLFIAEESFLQLDLSMIQSTIELASIAVTGMFEAREVQREADYFLKTGEVEGFKTQSRKAIKRIQKVYEEQLKTYQKVLGDIADMRKMLLEQVHISLSKSS